MRKLLAILLLAPLCFGQEIRRPTADFDSGNASWAVSACGYAPNHVTLSGALAWDAAGQSTSVTYLVRGSTTSGALSSRTFSTWQSPTSSYSALTLNINSRSTGWANLSPSSQGAACLRYSLDAGATWGSIRCDVSGSGWTQSTNAVSVPTSQDMSKIRVGVCVRGDSGEGSPALEGAADIILYDIWTTGTTASSTTPGTSGNGNAHRGSVIVF